MKNKFIEKNKSFSVELVTQNIKYIWKQPFFLTILIAILFVFNIIIPLSYLIASCLYKDSTGVISLSIFTQYSNLSDNQLLYTLFTDSLTPMLLLVSAVLLGTCSASSVFISEREKGTIYNVLYTPFGCQQIFKNKCYAALINAVFLSMFSGLLMGIITAIGSILLSLPRIISVGFLIELILIMPSITMLSIFLTFVLNRHTFRIINAFYTIGYLVLPVVLFYIGEFASLYKINNFTLGLLFVLVIAADIFLYSYIKKNLTPQWLLGYVD